MGGKSKEEAAVLAAEQGYFDGLLKGDTKALAQLMGADFLMIDVISGSEVPKDALFAVLELGQLKFEDIKQVEAERRTRMYGTTAIVTGRTLMRGEFLGQPFTAKSRYAHVYVQESGRPKLVSVQGTPVAQMPGATD